MKILTILGSPRRKGNTAAVLAKFEELAKSEHSVERINIVDYDVRGCLGCDSCFKHLDDPGCVQKDDGKKILGRILAADVVIYATPLYVWSYSAQLKALMDRHYCLVKWQKGEKAAQLMQGKSAALLVTCGDAVENNADVIQVEFEREMEYLGSRVVGKYIVPNCTLPKELGDKAENTAREMFTDLQKMV